MEQKHRQEMECMSQAFENESLSRKLLQKEVEDEKFSFAKSGSTGRTGRDIQDNG
jgi:hypothetical protein